MIPCNDRDRYFSQTAAGRWLAQAEALKPKLGEHWVSPLARVRIDPATSGFQGWTVCPLAGPVIPEEALHNGDVFILDFGAHTVGYLNLAVESDRAFQDAPVRLRLTCGEVLAEVAAPLDDYHGQLAASWLQDEVVTLDWLPTEFEFPRRMAFRYVRIEVVALSMPVRIVRCACRVVSSAGPLLAAETAGRMGAGPGGEEIPAVALRTLRNCMQTVFEDGPKRDRRLWVGDLRLQALANYASFDNAALVRRCLYLFAALTHPDGLVSACVYEYPRPVCGEIRLLPYALLFNTVLFEYASHSGDWQTARELWPVARRQIELLRARFDDQALFVRAADDWLFFDWSEADPLACMQALAIWVVRQTLAMARSLGVDGETDGWEEWLSRLLAVTRRHFVNAAGLVISGPKQEISWASAAWMVLADVLEGTAARAALRGVFTCEEAVRPVSPYLYHYVAEAMLHCGMPDEARELIERYWGGMIALGATSFWEVYCPGDDRRSPYGDHRINSYCHAWSCSPIWLFRQAEIIKKSRRTDGV